MKCVRQTDLRQARVAKKYEMTILAAESLCECVIRWLKIFFFSRMWILTIIPRKVNFKLVFMNLFLLMSYSHSIFDTKNILIWNDKSTELWLNSKIWRGVRQIWHHADIIPTCWGRGLPLANFEDLVLVVTSWWDVRHPRNMPPRVFWISFSQQWYCGTQCRHTTW